MKLHNDNKQFKKVLELFDHHNKNNSAQTCYNLVITQVLKACAHLGDIKRGKVIHEMVFSRVDKDVYILVSLIHMYMQCGDVAQAEVLFEKTANRTLPVYGALMKGYLTNNHAQKAIDIFNMIENPGEIAVNLFLNACAQLGTPEASDSAKQILRKMPKSFHSNLYIRASLLDVFMKCGDVDYAERMFGKIAKKTSAMYGAMIKGYLENNEPMKAIDLFNQLEKPGEVHVNLFFNACAQLGTREALVMTQNAFKHVPKAFHMNPIIVTSLLDALMKCGGVTEAESIFEDLSNKTIPMYGAMMKGYVENNQMNKTIDLFKQIREPNDVIMIVLFNACAHLRTKESLDITKQALRRMPKSYYSNPRLLTSLLDALMKCKAVEDAEKLFGTVPRKTSPMYGAMMKGEEDFFYITYTKKENISLGYVLNGLATKAIDLFVKIEDPDEVNIIFFFNACAHLKTKQALQSVREVLKSMPASYHSNSLVLSSLIDALVKCGSITEAESVFKRSERRTSSMYVAMMNGYNNDESPWKTLRLFDQMTIDMIEKDIVVCLYLIKALSMIGDYSLCQLYIKKFPCGIPNDNHVACALIDMWGRVGQVDEAKKIFGEVRDENYVTYTAMSWYYANTFENFLVILPLLVHCFGLNGYGNEAVELYHQMSKEFVSEVTNICVLNACSHSGLVNDARAIFGNIPVKTEKIYCAMIDCLSRASCLEESQQLLNEYERFNPPLLPMYTAILSGARNSRNTELSQRIHDRMQKLFPRDKDSLTAATILLANVYASTGESEKASDIRSKLSKSGAKKKIGLSWTTINGEVFVSLQFSLYIFKKQKFSKEFRAHDRSHPRSNEIYAELEKISEELVEHNHAYDSSCVTRVLKEDETVESVLNGHSERLAIAWNFVLNPKTTRIQLIKNLRVCSDCHAVTKLIAMIRQCEIVVRDANRIHHFYTNGQFFLVRTSDQVGCLTNVKDFQIQLNDTNLDEQIQNLTSRLINRTQQASFCSFNLSLLHTTRQVIVRYSRPLKVEADQIVVKTVVELVRNTSLVTTVQGKCTTHVCDLEYTISTVRWMLSEGKSYSNWFNEYQLKDCHGFPCLNRKLLDVRSARCIATARQPYVELEITYYCNSKLTDSKIFLLMWERVNMNKLFKTIKLTSSPGDETTVKTTTMRRTTMMRRTATTTKRKTTTTTTCSAASTKLCTSSILLFLLLINMIFFKYCL
ncbi:unnamed protein product [Adineta ricciae]|uniref:DYW domain-containing protein n=2 Tax=Adineta ricciae TaxID=249248 RepID=A0A815C540_ADIRI|nr:unnamed protein product [Adineta ricciae]